MVPTSYFWTSLFCSSKALIYHSFLSISILLPGIPVSGFECSVVVMCELCVEEPIYLRPASGCTSWACETAAAAAAAETEDGDGCFGLLTLVLLLANSSLMVWGKSGSKRTPCCKRIARDVLEKWLRSVYCSILSGIVWICRPF